MNADMESRPASAECIVPLGESVYEMTDDEREYLDAGLVPVDHSPNGKPVFELNAVLRHRLGK